jgi:hypothetical protein
VSYFQCRADNLSFANGKIFNICGLELHTLRVAHPVRSSDERVIRSGVRAPPDEEVEGLILGFGFDSIPTEYLRRKRVPATLWMVAAPGYIGNFSLLMTVFRYKPVTRPNHLSRSESLVRSPRRLGASESRDGLVSRGRFNTGL